MSKFLKYTAFAFLLFQALGAFAQSSKYKTMIQMNTYDGKKAYVVVSLINPKGEYEKTLALLGPDKQWYNTLEEWHKFQNKTKEKVSAVTSASIGGGERGMRTIDIDDSKIDKGYKIRFESAVEEQKYIVKEVEIPFTTTDFSTKTDGKEYIRFVKINKVQ